MALTLKESFSNVKIVCHNASMRREEWLTIDESLNNIAGALQAYEHTFKETKDEEPIKKIMEDTLDEE